MEELSYRAHMSEDNNNFFFHLNLLSLIMINRQIHLDLI